VHEKAHEFLKLIKVLYISIFLVQVHFHVPGN